MSNFRYQARDSAGQVTSGVIQAESLLDASNLVRSRGAFVLSVEPIQQASRNFIEILRSVNVQPGPSLKDVYSFTNQLAVMIKAGINIRSAISGVAEQVENPKFQKILFQIKSDVEAGKPFSDALTRHPKVFSPLYVNMVKASEMSGNFGHMLERIASYQMQQIETRRMVRGAMVYPIIIGVMAIVTTIFLLTFVLPRFTMLFAGKESLLPTPTIILISMSKFMLNYWYVLVGGLVAFVVTLLQFIRTPKGRIHWDRFKLHIPLVRKMLRALYITRGLHTMGELISAGVPMLETLEITAEVSGNALYRNLWMEVHGAVKEGSKIAEPLARQPLLPQNVVQMISAGEESGKLGEVLSDVAEFYGEELKSTIKSVTSMIEPIMIVVMGAVVGFIAMSVILPIFKMSSLVKH